MNTEKNLRPVLFFALIGIIAVSGLLFIIAQFTERTLPPVTINKDTRISKFEYWQDENGTTKKDIVYEDDQSVYTSSFIGEYKSYGINPRVAKISKNGWNLLLLNKNNILPDNYKLDLAEIAGSEIQMDADAAIMYNKMYVEASKEGIILTPVSGYRTISLQRKLFENTVEEILSKTDKDEKEAHLEAIRGVSIPATSEHNAGLSVDIIEREVEFSQTEEYKWLYKNAHKYGFILRYPEGKENATGVDFKPYHWRFVGINAATEIKTNGQCLEEYLK